MRRDFDLLWSADGSVVLYCLMEEGSTVPRSEMTNSRDGEKEKERETEEEREEM